VEYLLIFKKEIEDVYNLLKKPSYFLYELLNKDIKKLSEEELLKNLEIVEEALNGINQKIIDILEFFKQIENDKKYYFNGKNLLLIFYNQYFLFKEQKLFLIRNKKELFEYLESLKKHVNKLKDLSTNLVDKIDNNRELIYHILQKYYSLFSEEQSHMEYVLSKIKELEKFYFEIKIEKLYFSKLAIEKIKKQKNINSLKTIFMRLESLVKEGISNQIRIFGKGPDNLRLIDYPEGHTKERFALLPVYNGNNIKEIIVYDIFFDHLGKDKKEYESYWRGEYLKLNKEEMLYLMLDKELLSFIMTKENNILKTLLKIIRD
jgi:hypothetical protein